MARARGAAKALAVALAGAVAGAPASASPLARLVYLAPEGYCGHDASSVECRWWAQYRKTPGWSTVFYAKAKVHCVGTDAPDKALAVSMLEDMLRLEHALLAMSMNSMAAQTLALQDPARAERSETALRDWVEERADLDGLLLATIHAAATMVDTEFEWSTCPEAFARVVYVDRSLRALASNVRRVTRPDRAEEDPLIEIGPVALTAPIIEATGAVLSEAEALAAARDGMLLWIGPGVPYADQRWVAQVASLVQRGSGNGSFAFGNPEPTIRVLAFEDPAAPSARVVTREEIASGDLGWLVQHYRARRDR